MLQQEFVPSLELNSTPKSPLLLTCVLVEHPLLPMLHSRGSGSIPAVIAAVGFFGTEGYMLDGCLQVPMPQEFSEVPAQAVVMMF